ncbi:Zinc finger DNA binding protein [Operophtera brumata]|uniref:Zinc finger DNA binding protein n=1 Tax=Operophtera brumata TaxID=104452 RepID=A0A0L7LCR6_OPEBR|nr:Zinc finger DNA binding protein [Operophtera brumata]
MNTQRTPPAAAATDKTTNTPRSKRPRPIYSPEKVDEVENQCEIMAMLTSWKSEQEAVLSKIISDVAEIKAEIREVHKTNSEIEKTLDFVCKNYEDLKIRVECLEKRREERDNHWDKLEDKIEELERNARSTSIEIRGIPVKQNETKGELLSIVDNLHNKIKVQVERGFIRNIYRTKEKPNGERPIVMDVTTPIKKYNILKAVKEYNYHHIGDKLNTMAIGLEGKKAPIYLSDFLTLKAKRIYFLAREVAKSNGYRYCWSTNGKIFLRKAKGSPLISITSEVQLEDLKQKK